MHGDSSVIPDKTLEDLEWHAVIDAVSSRCTGPRAAAGAKSLGFLDEDGARSRLEEIKELSGLVDNGDPLPSCPVEFMDDIIERLRASGILKAKELLTAGRLCSMYCEAVEFASERTPALSRIEKVLFEGTSGRAISAGLKRLSFEIESCIEADATISDLASPLLKKLRKEARGARERLVRKLDSLMEKHEAILQDRFYTQRDGRYVLPVRTDSHEKLPGIVHATSASGATLFVEPRDTVGLGNTLRLAEVQVEREQERILAELSTAAADLLGDIVTAYENLTSLDMLCAITRLSCDLDCVFPLPAQKGEVRLLKSRHPLLVLDGVDVVANDIEILPGHALVISGPNAGGKTVALKTLGLCVLMYRAGMPVPAADGTCLAHVGCVYSDIGDDQNISLSLSTFSAHMKNISRILDLASGGDLVLLDELAVGTDPSQGAALAEALLVSMVESGASVVAATHYDGLKVLADSDERMENASVNLDMQTLTPTFRLHNGLPGSSCAFEVAGRFGIPHSVVDKARSLCAATDGAGRFAQTIESMMAIKRRLEIAETDAAGLRAGLEQKQREIDSTLEKIKQQGKKKIDAASAALLSEISRAREEVKMASKRLKRRIVSTQDVDRSRKQVEAVAARVSVDGDLAPADTREPAGRRASLEELEQGMDVWVAGLKAQGSIIELSGSNQALVSVGSVKTRVKLSDLRIIDSVPGEKEKLSGKTVSGSGSVGIDAAADDEAPFSTDTNTCDLRGLRADEAVERCEKFLDETLHDERKVAFFIHGHGTGALKSAIRKYLADSAYVSKFRAGARNEGGDGVTVVWIK